MANAPEKPQIGQVLDGKYELVRVLGEGGMGIVFEAVHTRMRQRVAVKVLLPELVGFEEVRERFEREARAAGTLRGRHVARVTDVDVTESGLPFMVMEFLQGHDLGTELESRLKLPVDEAVGYVLQACLALQEAHQVGIVHRDLKPANLFLAREEGGQVVKLLDFGISKVVHEADRLTAADTVMGTAMYMSPEQVRSSKNVDGRSDIWALGVLLYELLSGRPPFLGTTTQIAAAIVTDDVAPLSTHGVVLPNGLEEVIRTALARDPDARFQSVRDFGVALFPYAGVYGMGLEAFSSRASISTWRHSLPSALFQSEPVRGSDGPRTEVSRTPSMLTQGAWTGSSETRRTKQTRFAIVMAGAVACTFAGVGLVRRMGTPGSAAAAGAASTPVETDKSVDVATVARSRSPAAAGQGAHAPTALIVNSSGAPRTSPAAPRVATGAATATARASVATANAAPPLSTPVVQTPVSAVSRPDVPPAPVPPPTAAPNVLPDHL